MKFIAKYFWLLLPVALVVGTYREANSTVVRYWAFSQDREKVLETQKDLNSIVMKVSINYRATQTLPKDLKRFLELLPQIGQKNRGRDLDVDSWLVPYQLRDHEDRFEIVSCGPDLDCENEVDNLVEGAKKVARKTPDTGEEGGEGDKMDAVFKNVDEMKKNVDSHNKQLEGL